MRNHSFIFVFVTLSFLVFSCSNEKAAPLDLISPDLLSLIIADVKIVDAAYQAGIPPNQHTNDTLSLDDSSEYESVLKEKIKSFKNKIQVAESGVAIDTNTVVNAEEIKPEEYSPIEEVNSPDIYAGHTGADYDFIFKKHGVGRKQFESSLAYYAQFPDQFFSICEKALEVLSEKQLILTEKMRKKNQEEGKEEIEE